MAVAGEVWRVNFGPFEFDDGQVSLTVGGEIDDGRPAVVVNAPSVTHNGLRIVVPVTDWKTYHQPDVYVPLSPTPTNGLTKSSSAVTPQLKSVATERFERRLGVLSADEFDRVLTGVLVSLGLTGS